MAQSFRAYSTHGIRILHDAKWFCRAREITVTEAGASHPMMKGRGKSFAAPAVHRHEVSSLPETPGTTVLAGNAHSKVQAIAVYIEEDGDVIDVWGSQYHPECSAAEIAEYIKSCPSITFDGKSPEEVDQLFATIAAADTDEEAAAKLGTSCAELQLNTRATELVNWIEHVLDRKESSEAGV